MTFQRNCVFKLFILFFLSQLFTLAVAQQDRYYTSEQGLSGTSFTSIVQDHDGFLWFASNAGLNKFDGHSFSVYQHSVADSNSLDIDAVNFVFCASNGRLWVGTESGLLYYNKKKDNFIRFAIKYEYSELHPQVTCILEDVQHNIWLTTSMGLMKVYTGGSHVEFFNRKFVMPLLERDLMNSAIFDNEGLLWVGSDKKGLLCYDPKTQKFTSYMHDPSKNSVCDNSILSLGKDNLGNIIIGSVKGGLSIYSKKNKTFHNIEFSRIPGNLFTGGVYSIITDRNGVIWVGTERNGLKILDPVHFTLSDANSFIQLDFVSDSKILCYNDRQGNLWLGINYAGIYLKKEQSKQFFSIRKKVSTDFNLTNNTVKAVLLDHDKDLWIGTDGGGLNFLGKGDTQTKAYLHNTESKTSLPDNAVISLFEDKRDNVWIGTYLGGLSLLDKKTKQFKTFLIDSLGKGRDLNYVTSIIADISDASGNLWVATNGGGLQRFNVATRKFTAFTTSTINNKKIDLPLFLIAILQDRDHTLWLGSYNGLVCWNEKKNIYKEFTVNNGLLNNDRISSLLEDKHGQIWVATLYGLYIIRKSDFFVRKYFIADGLPSNALMGILEDNKGKMWISTSNGLSKFDPKNQLFRNYYTVDGLPGNEYRPTSCYKADNGFLYFGGTSGLVYFNPDSIRETSGFPTLVFTSFKIFNLKVPIGKLRDKRTILKNDINDTENITLRYSDNNFTLEFAAIEFNAPEKIKYAFIMQGFEKTWTIKDFSQRYAAYTNLSPGTYTFLLKVSNTDGIWNDHVRSITIRIEPPFWLTWWAYIIYAFLAVLAFVFARKQVLFRIRMKHKLHLEHLERQKLEELNQSKMEFFSNVSHEFRTPLTLIIGPLERLLNADSNSLFKRQLEMIHRNSLRLLRQVNLLLDLQKVEKNEMHLKARFADIVSFTREISVAFEEITYQKNISLSFQSSIESFDMWFDPDKLDKVLFNLLSNAMKFTPKGGKITVRIDKDKNDAFATPLDDFVMITVEDTGKGMKEEFLHRIFDRFYQIESNDSEMQKGTGIGLHLSKYLVELHQGQIAIASKVDEGSRFDIILPAGSNHLTAAQKIIDLVPVVIDLKEEVLPVMIIEPEKKKSERKKQAKVYRILIVEDDYEVRDFMKNELLDQYEVLEAVDGMDGWMVAFKEMPDLIISDVMMPRMNGIQLCAKLKTEPQTSHIPVILLTARTSIENRIEGLETGADSYIPKPFHPQHLKVRIEKLIELRQKMISKYSKSVGFEVKEMTLTSADERFMQKAIDLVKENIANSELNIEDMSVDLGMSRVHLYRKLKALTNQTPSEFVRTIRLKQAAYLIGQNKINISEVAYAVGFNSHQYFSNCFQNYFNMSPTEYSQKEKNKI